MWLVYAVAVAGDIGGDILYYAIGHFGGHTLVHKYGHKIGLTETRLKKIKHVFHLHPFKIFAFGKITHSFGMYILIAAGILKTPFTPFVTFNFLATLPKVLVLVLVGYYFGVTVGNGDLKTYAIVGTLFAVVLFVGFTLLQKYTKVFLSNEERDL